jgi:hypothetical protein
MQLNWPTQQQPPPGYQQTQQQSDYGYRQPGKEPKKTSSSLISCLGLIVGIALLVGGVILVAKSGAPPVSTVKPPPEYIQQYENRQPPYARASGERIHLVSNPTAKDVSFAELRSFILEDATDDGVYLLGVRDCVDFAEQVHNNAERAGIKAAFVTVNFEGEEIGHALNAFKTTDGGLVFIDCTGPGLLERLTLNPALFGPQRKDPFEDWSHDTVAYTKIGSELGFVHISAANSLAYAFYDGWNRQYQTFEAALDQYNRDVQSYNDWVRGRVFYRGTPEAVRKQNWASELDARKAALERDELALGPAYKPMGIVETVEIYW